LRKYTTSSPDPSYVGKAARIRWPKTRFPEPTEEEDISVFCRIDLMQTTCILVASEEPRERHESKGLYFDLSQPHYTNSQHIDFHFASNAPPIDQHLMHMMQ
jgi:hypothetical protein